MLPSDARLREGPAFRRAVRRGRRCGRRAVVLHLLTAGSGTGRSPEDPPRVGFVVSRAVGSAVVRNRVRRRLRHVLRDRVDSLPPGSDLVVRALPDARGYTSTQMAQEVDTCLERLLAGRA